MTGLLSAAAGTAFSLLGSPAHALPIPAPLGPIDIATIQSFCITDSACVVSDKAIWDFVYSGTALNDLTFTTTTEGLFQSNAAETSFNADFLFAPGTLNGLETFGVDYKIRVIPGSPSLIDAIGVSLNADFQPNGAYLSKAIYAYDLATNTKGALLGTICDDAPGFFNCFNTLGISNDFLNISPDLKALFIEDRYVANGGSVNSGSNSFSQVNPTTSVPGPLPLLGAASAFGFSRKLRRRIKITA